MSTNTVIVPPGMSYVNAFRALYIRAREHPAFFDARSEFIRVEEETVSTSKKVASIFGEMITGCRAWYEVISLVIGEVITDYRSLYMDHMGGRVLRTDFIGFPFLDTRLYDETYGPGSAQKALDSYANIPSSLRFDANDTYRFSDLINRN